MLIFVATHPMRIFPLCNAQSTQSCSDMISIRGQDVGHLQPNYCQIYIFMGHTIPLQHPTFGLYWVTVAYFGDFSGAYSITENNTQSGFTTYYICCFHNILAFLLSLIQFDIVKFCKIFLLKVQLS